MIAAWMLVSVLLGAVIALGALALDSVCRAARTSTRWTWAGALALLVLLTALVPLRRTPAAGRFHVTVSVATARSGANAVTATMPVMQRALVAARAMMAAPVARLAHVVTRAVGPAADRWLLLAWLVSSLALLILGAIVLRRLLQARRAWPVSSLQGERVHVAPDAGPAVLGFLRGAIVVPCWLAECSPDVQQVVLAHEREHLRARDPLLLALGAASAVLLPWNPAVWWMLARLRLAVELDCDRRVIDAGVRTRDYGSLLIDLAGRMTGIPLGAPLVGLTMLAEHTTHLERRIVAMSAPRPRHAALRIASGSLVALAAALAACEAKMPTSVDVDNMTAASAERAAVDARLLSANDSLRTYYVDGRLTSAAAAHAVPSAQIASIVVAEPRVGSDSSLRPSVWITTRGAASPRAQFEKKLVGTARMHAASGDSVRFAGVIFIDGRRVDQSAMKQLAPNDIQSIEVIKGPRAAELYPDEPTAAQGVIQITTKHAAAH